MNVGISDRAGTRRVAYALAVVTVAANLRDRLPVTVYDPDLPDQRWRLTPTTDALTITGPPATLFDPEPAIPVWLARLIEATTPLRHRA
jgi:hypothetical protein